MSQSDFFPLNAELHILLERKLTIGQKVEYNGNVDEIEAYCPLYRCKLEETGSITDTYIGLGYNLKLARKTVLIDELKAIEK